MSKFKIRMKLQGFELEIEGSREDMPLIAENLGQQFVGLLQPAGAIIEGESLELNKQNRPATDYLEKGSGSAVAKRKPRKRTATAASTGEELGEEAVDWKHDSSKYGTPKQDWSTADKSVWLLYVVKAETGQAELSATRITKTFNKHFRQAKQILNFNVQRDLGKLKVKKGAATLVGEDTTKSPAGWFLTESGEKKALELIQSALGNGAA